MLAVKKTRLLKLIFRIYFNYTIDIQLLSRMVACPSFSEMRNEMVCALRVTFCR